MSWGLGRIVAFDTESTGVDVESDRIVTAAVIGLGDGMPAAARTWLADPGIDIPEQASTIHGVTTARARAEGRPAAEVVKEIASKLAEFVAHRLPIVAMNARFDLTLLDRECARHGLPPLAELAGAEPLVVDPYVIDKAVDKYRKGSRKLIDMARHYGVALGGDAHEAGADALAAARIAYKQAARYPAARQPLEQLHAAQVIWAREQAVSLQAYLRKSDPAAVVEPEWPLVPRQQGGAR
ncbi:exonuclease domain-containing protein [Kitasatospora sp. CB01950]|uniref:exonuclease domain-containing protein n=1 Tax=Kitasatospora sp. CB01950 TaxID=1703930 RepID=UPI00093ECB53|nr:exonuclease domain-containing protein [Kitasatospora sp. CB01950]OKJ06803.1 DNA polymerase III subunit epsilon [Kitasatospora sp. CB01950]